MTARQYEGKMSNSALDYLTQAQAILDRITNTQMDAIERAAEICAQAIAGDGLVHMFGSGHSRIFVEEMFPRHGSFPGFHPIVELSLTYHNLVVGSNGQRQAMFLEHVEGFGQVILRNFRLRRARLFPDLFQQRHQRSGDRCGARSQTTETCPSLRSYPWIIAKPPPALHSSGKKLPDIADIVIDNCTPGGDALVHIPGPDRPRRSRLYHRRGGGHQCPQMPGRRKADRPWPTAHRPHQQPSSSGRSLQTALRRMLR